MKILVAPIEEKILLVPGFGTKRLQRKAGTWIAENARNFRCKKKNPPPTPPKEGSLECEDADKDLNYKLKNPFKV